VRPNIPKDETEALNLLIKLQKECQIVIKPCDKGAGIIICNYNDNVTSCEKDSASNSVDNQTTLQQNFCKRLRLSQIKN
jgi:hypothetical protein